MQVVVIVVVVVLIAVASVVVVGIVENTMVVWLCERTQCK